MINRYYRGKPNLVIFFESKKHYQNHHYFKSYLDLSWLLDAYFSVFFVSGFDRYLGNGVFKNSLYFENHKLMPGPTTVGAKVVFDRQPIKGLAFKGGKSWLVVNHPFINHLGYDKYFSYLKFKNFFKLTCPFSSHAALIKCLKKIKTQKVVCKPRGGYGGQGVIIDDKITILKKIKKITNYIAQEFIDTSGGVPALKRGYHDFRTIVMNGRIIQAYIRTPKKGSLLANIAQGGSLKEISIIAIPPALKKIVKTIDSTLQNYGPRIYAIDFGFENGRPYIIEINNVPGLPFKKERYYKIWHQAAVKVLLSALSKVSFG